MKKKFIEPDILKGLAIIGVVLIHISGSVINTPSLNTYSKFLGVFVNQASRFAVPSFLMMSGWGLTISNKIEYGYCSLLKNQLSKIIGLYLVWNIIYYIINFDEYSFIGFIKGTLLGTNYYHLYYVPITVSFYILYPFLLKMGKTTIGLIGGLLISLISQTADSFINISALNSAQNIFNWVFYFIFGIWLADRYTIKIDKLKNKRAIFIILLVISMMFIIFENLMEIDLTNISKSITSMRPSIIIYSVLFSIVMLSGKINNKTLIDLSDASYGIFLSHPLILAVFEKGANIIGFPTSNLLYIFIAFVIVMPISIFTSKFINKVIITIKVEIMQKYFKFSGNV